MNSYKFRFWNLSWIVLLWLLASNRTAAEIVPDQTLPINSTVTPQDNIRLIEGGTRRGDNLFHSFKEFSFSVLTGDTTGDTAFFNNDSAVRNIITRVTGGSGSNIDGMIRANGTANLFFINPNSIIFGKNASLNIGGSFIASTANSLKFADGTEFSATAPQASPLLTVSVPLGLQFGSNPGKIVNQSQASPNGELTDADPPNPIGLKVPNSKTLALVGGNVTLEGGNLTTTGGRIELASVAGTGLVKLSEIDKGYALDYADVGDFADMQFSQGAIAYGSGEGGGDIQLQGGNITLTDGSLVFSSTLGTGNGGNVVINARKLTVEGGAFVGTFTWGGGQAGNVLVRASDSVQLLGTSLDGSAPSSLLSQVLEQATGNGGNLMIETKRLLIRDGAIVDASTFGEGRAGNVIVKALDVVELIGTTVDGAFPSGIFAQVAQGAIENAGDAGNLMIDTRQLTVQDGAQISTAARNGGNGGNLTINASGSIQLSGTSPLATASLLDSYRSGIFVSAEPGSTGNVGNLNLSTGLLTVENGARISADNLGNGEGGTATLNLRQLVIQKGGEIRAGSFGEGPGGTLTINAADSVEVVGTGSIGSNSFPSILFTNAQASGKAGNLIITTNRLNVKDGAEVTVSGKGSGSAGNLTITTNDLRLNQGKLTAETNAGEGANIKLQNLDLLFMQNESLISAQAFQDANGGNINVDAAKGFVVAVPEQNNDIVANAFLGNGGKINITTQGIFGIEERKATSENRSNDIDASSEFGLNGTVAINTPNVDPSQGLVQLPAIPINVEVAQGCQAQGEQSSVAFYNTGRGGIAPNPYEPLSSSQIWEDVPSPSTSASTINSPNKIVEAQGWVVNQTGEVTLVAEIPASQGRCHP
ncbi:MULTISPECIES: filamentous hemagglutinin N-terminal domain-containing protein [Fischerella]|uniref:Filamentous hemagglutinin n=1 Tax=Fischerella muscicola CCMEE 5323 TaxID=2019572 RepID=A0A2N6K3Q3_FISMU|nr:MULTISPECIES: S-layer family protein [Fischerella]MBD2430026.1 S-layer family protein [Fischerella sp. FACHB-380]PLZ90287.1 filamentous hemagglutinin [Fischerella muscicola CCMEE 5323]